MNHNNSTKQFVTVLLIAIILGVAVYGTYLPMRKSQNFIATLGNLQTTPVSSLQELEDRLAVPLNYPSPIGQEELVRNVANSVLSFEQRGLDATSTAALIGFMNSYYDPILDRGKGMSFGQDLYLVGAINEIAFSETGDPTYILASQKYYEEARTLGPNRPQSLYGLFDVYRAEDDVTDTVQVASTIETNWPTDQTIPQALAQFLAAQSTSTVPTTGK